MGLYIYTSLIVQNVGESVSAFELARQGMYINVTLRRVRTIIAVVESQ